MANLGGLGKRWFAIFVLANVLTGFVLIPLKLYPEFLIWQPTAWVTVFLIWGQLSSQVRAHKSPPIFPRVPVEPERIEEVDGFVERLVESEDEASSTHQDI